MDPTFAAFIERLHPAFFKLKLRPPITGGATPNYETGGGIATRGVYLFSEGGRAMYVGRSNRLLARYQNHWGHAKTHKQAAFAFKLAREATGWGKATYKPGEGSRKYLAAEPIFMEAFAAAKKRIKAMEYRWVEETDPTCQCLLEIYAAVALDTKYNDFDTH